MKNFLLVLLVCTPLTKAISQVDAESNFYTEVAHSNYNKNLVTDYATDNDFATDDSSNLQTAIDAISSNGGGVLTIPSGNYSFESIDLKSNVHIEIDPGAVIRPADTGDQKNYTIFGFGEKMATISNVSIRCSDTSGYTEGNICNATELGRYTVDLSLTANKNVTLFAVRNATNFLVADFHVIDDYTVFSVVSLGATKVGGYNGNSVRNTMSNVTEDITEMIENAVAENTSYISKLETVKTSHTSAIETLLPANLQEAAITGLQTIIEDLRSQLDVIYNAGSLSGDATVVSLTESFEDRLFSYVYVMADRSEIETHHFMPENGIIKSGSVCNAHYGYGVVQMQAGKNVLYKDLYGFGGATLRLETGYNYMNNLQYGGMDKVVARNIYTEQGNAGVMISPHAMHNGTVDVDGVTAVGSGFALRVEGGFISKKYNQDIGLEVGTFGAIKVRNVVSTFGSLAQLKSKHFYLMPEELVDDITTTSQDGGESVLGPSIAGVLKDGNYLCTEDGKVNVSIENVSQTDFEYQEPIIPEENVNACESLVLGITSEKELIKIYPNPIKGALFVTAANSYKLDIYSTTSSLMFSVKENEGGQVHSYNVSKLVSGFYIVKLTMISGVETKIIYIE